MRRPPRRPWSVLPGRQRAYAQLLDFLELALLAPPLGACPPWLCEDDWYAYLIHQILRCTDAWRPRAAA